MILIPFFLNGIYCVAGKSDNKGSGLMWISPGESNTRSINTDFLLRVPKPCNVVDPTTDPLYPFQWQLKNTGQALYRASLTKGTPGEDINVEPVWSQKNFGQSVLISIVDDGLDRQAVAQAVEVAGDALLDIGHVAVFPLLVFHHASELVEQGNVGAGVRLIVRQGAGLGPLAPGFLGAFPSLHRGEVGNVAEDRRQVIGAM